MPSPLRAVGQAVRAVYRATVVAGMNRSRRRRGLPDLDRRGRRQLAGLTCFMLVVGSCAVSIAGTTPDVPRSTTTPTPPTPSSTYAAGGSAQVGSSLGRSAPTAAAPTAPPEQLPDGERVTVSRIIDGDTFELTDGRTIRPLGIDSCEMDTPGGRQAKSAASVLQAGEVILTAEPGIDLDRYDRLLRYVHTSNGDFGEYMVQYDHTGVYQGDNDASDEYIQRLYAKDLIYAANPPSGRECGQDPPPPPSGGGSVNVGEDDDDGESRFCRKRWWC